MTWRTSRKKKNREWNDGTSRVKRKGSRVSTKKIENTRNLSSEGSEDARAEVGVNGIVEREQH